MTETGNGAALIEIGDLVEVNAAFVSGRAAMSIRPVDGRYGQIWPGKKLFVADTSVEGDGTHVLWFEEYPDYFFPAKAFVLVE